MKFTTRAIVTGIKGSKGRMENGTEFDSTKVYIQTDLDDSKEMGKGFVTMEYNWGKSENFQAMKHGVFPVECEVDLEVVSNGKTQKTIVNGLRPVSAGKKAA
jgi:hypothetical protein